MKTLKKTWALVLALAMILSLTACAGNTTTETKKETEAAKTQTQAAQTEAAGEKETEAAEAPASLPLDGTWPKETVKIGYVTYDTTRDEHLAIVEYFDYLKQYFNIEVMMSESLADAEGELNFINSCAAAGCDAIFAYYNVALAESAKAAMDQGMYYWGGFGGDTAAYEEVKDNPLYLGAYTVGDADYEAGKMMAEALIAQGCKKLVLCSGGAAFGVQMFIDRQQGFLDAIEAADGVELVKNIEGWPGTDAFAADQTAVLDMDIDAIASTFGIAMWFQPLMTSSKAGQVKLATIGLVDETMVDFFNDGTMACVVYDCPEVVFGNAIPLILNAVNGDRLVNEEGVPELFLVQRMAVTTADQYNAIFNLHANGEYLVSGEDVAQMIKAYNPDLTAQEFYDFYGSFSAESVDN